MLLPQSPWFTKNSSLNCEGTFSNKVDCGPQQRGDTWKPRHSHGLHVVPPPLPSPAQLTLMVLRFSGHDLCFLSLQRRGVGFLLV